MQPRGFEEKQQASYQMDDPQKLVGQIRRLGPDGPAYEIISVDGAGNVLIEVIYSEERVMFSMQEILEDPMAETIP
jgi:hypothetical protein